MSLDDFAFDLRTAIVLGALTTELIAGLLLLSWRSLPRAVHPSLRWWLAGLLLHPLGLLLVALRGLAPNWLSVWTANTALALSLACMAIALRNFYQLPERRGRLYLICGLVALLSVWFELVQPAVSIRVVAISVLLAVLLGSSAHAVFRRGGPAGLIPRLTGALFAFAAAVMLVRSMVHAYWPVDDAGLLAASPFNLLCVGTLVLMPILVTVGFLLMCSERSQELLESAAQVDYLTGIYNRRAIEELSVRAIAAARRHGTPLAVMSIDIDHFKRINDDLGHHAGDRALVEAVDRIRKGIRTEDLFGRHGGEEFVVVFPATDGASALALAERVRLAFDGRAIVLAEGSVEVTVSIGVAELGPRDVDFSNLLRRADRAMYAAKNSGRNRILLSEVETNSVRQDDRATGVASA